jgi:hypothetical protein
MQDFSALRFNFDLLGNVFIFTPNEWSTTRFDLGFITIKVYDAPPHSLKDSNASSKMKTTEKEKIEICSLICNASRVDGHVGAPRCGLGRMTSESIIHANLHKPNNKFVSA